MNLQIHQVAFGLRHGVLGASDNRIGIWTQGCSLRKCPGCTSSHIWPADGGHTIDITSLLRLFQSQNPAPSGLTISGGEPTDQAEGVLSLIAGFRVLFPDSEIVLYSGLPWPNLSERFPELVDELDVVIAGPYKNELPATPLSGSSNQEVHILTPLAQRLYKGWRCWPTQVQVAAKDNRLITIGIPDSQRIASAAQQIGADTVSWSTLEGDDNHGEK